ncbi:hypothetical protein RSAG8_13527, partial [Rhizoctonia solani AG-8 WAC10335]
MDGVYFTPIDHHARLKDLNQSRADILDVPECKSNTRIICLWVARWQRWLLQNARLVGLINTMNWIENITAGISNKLEWLVTGTPMTVTWHIPRALMTIVAPPSFGSLSPPTCIQHKRTHPLL